MLRQCMHAGGKTKDVGPTMLTDGTTNIIKAMKKMSSTKRVAVVTSIGGNSLYGWSIIAYSHSN